MAALCQCPWQEEPTGRAAESSGISQEWRWAVSCCQVLPWVCASSTALGLLLMRKGSSLCSQHPLTKENTAAAKFPAILHENKTINTLEILRCKVSFTFFLQSGCKVTSAVNSDFIAVHLSPCPDTPPRHCALCSTNWIPRTMGDSSWWVNIWQVIR